MQAGASMFAVIPIVGLVGRGTGQAIKLTAKETAEVAAKVAAEKAAKEAAERVAREAAERTAKEAAEKLALEAAKILPSQITVSQKIVNDFVARGWSEQLIRDTVKTPFAIRQALNKATNNIATVFYRSDGSYVVIDNLTKEVIQISKIGDKSWIPDSSIINPFKP